MTVISNNTSNKKVSKTWSCFCKTYLIYIFIVCTAIYLCLCLVSKHGDTKVYNGTIPLQFRVQPDEIYKQMLDLANVPQEFRKGNVLLRQRTYPRTPRKSKCNGCFSYIYDNILAPKSCDAPGDIQMLIVITTVPSARETRDAMRQTWLSLTKNNTASVRYLFLLGSGWLPEQQANVKKENKIFGDILQDDYIDSYFNLSIKALSGFKYGSTVCNRAQFIMRSADDNYVNLPSVLPILKNDWKKVKDSMIGKCRKGGTPVIRDKNSKWAVSKNEWPEAKYPAYVVGTTFIMSQATTKMMYEAAQNIPYFVLEDVYFGEVARQSGIKLQCYAHFVDSVPNFDKKVNQQQCPLNQWYRAVHNVGSKQQFLLWKFCQKTKSI